MTQTNQATNHTCMHNIHAHMHQTHAYEIPLLKYIHNVHSLVFFFIKKSLAVKALEVLFIKVNLNSSAIFQTITGSCSIKVLNTQGKSLFLKREQVTMRINGSKTLKM